MTDQIGTLSAQPVIVSTDAPKGLHCVPVIGYTPATLPADVSVAGNLAAQPVYVVSAAQIASGEFALVGGTPVPMVAGVTGLSANGDQAPQAVYIVSGSLALNAPTGLVATAYSSSQINLTWNAVTGAASYIVERSLNGITGWTSVGTPATASYSNTGLTGNTTYYYLVKAVDAGGTSEPSSTVNATTPPTFAQILLANATYAWLGSDATLSGWQDLVAGVNAAPGGSGTTLGTLNGRACPVLNASGWCKTSAFASAISQPYTIVSVSQRTDALSLDRYICDGIGASNRGAVLHLNSNSSLSIFAGTVLGTAGTNSTAASVVVSTFNGASSSIVRNGSSIASGNAGAQTLTGLEIGARNDNTLGFIGPIALVAIISGTNYAARAATIAAAARTYYGI